MSRHRLWWASQTNNKNKMFLFNPSNPPLPTPPPPWSRSQPGISMSSPASSLSSVPYQKSSKVPPRPFVARFSIKNPAIYFCCSLWSGYYVDLSMKVRHRCLRNVPVLSEKRKAMKLLPSEVSDKPCQRQLKPTWAMGASPMRTARIFTSWHGTANYSSLGSQQWTYLSRLRAETIHFADRCCISCRIKVLTE